jgi:Tfp pilus assembly protein PilF
MKTVCALVNFLSLAVIAGCLGGCATGPKPPPGLAVLDDAAFKPATVRIDPQEAMALSPAMRQFLDNEIAVDVRNKGAREGLIDALYTKGRLQLDYDSEATRTAAEAFDARRGNCMSLVLMTAAFARQLNMPVRFNSVYTDESWTRFNDMFFVAGHVNISLMRPAVPFGQAAMTFGGDLLTIDFMPRDMMRGQRSFAVEEATILAMYLNNRAAEALTANDVDNAYWWVRAAIVTDSRWLAAYNTLAVLYHRKGLAGRAESTLRLVLDREPMNTQALSNLVLILSEAGKRNEAQKYADQLAQVQPVPPYKFFDEGVAAMKSGEYAAARQLFRKEIARAAYVPEFHFWLALANYGMGDLSSTKGELEKAVENSATAKDRRLYGAKLAWLNEQRAIRH